MRPPMPTPATRARPCKFPREQQLGAGGMAADPGPQDKTLTPESRGMAPIAHVLFNRIMRFNPKNPDWLNRDRFVLS